VLHVQNLHKTYGAATVLADVSFVLNDGEHVGLIGPNGTGKSTLLRCLVGAEQADSGTLVLTPVGARIGYLPQAFAEADARTVGEVVAAAQADLRAAEAAMQRAADALAAAGASGSQAGQDSAEGQGTQDSQDRQDGPDGPDSPDGPDRPGSQERLQAALAAYDEAVTTFEAFGGYARQARADSVLGGLGLGEVDLLTPVARLSGGQKTRLGLAVLLLAEPALLLLDEPTNHLDVDALEWLEAFLASYPHAALIVSHDRVFLDATVSRILYLDPETRSVRSYPGGYADFAAARAHERALQEATWRRQQEYVERVQRDVGRLKSGARSIELSTTARQPGLRKFARRKAALAKSRERKLERFLDSDERVDRPKLRWPINLDFGPPPPGGRALLRVEDVSFGYPDASPLFEHVSFEVRYGQRLALVGPNGAGKTTLLRLIEGRLQPTAGQVQLGAGARIGVMAQEHETLDPDLSVLQTVLRERPMSEQDARSFLPYFLFYGESVFKPVRTCSLGERSRLQLARLVLQGCNLLLLDEPINHLDVESREHFEAALDAFEGSVIVVAHDRAFLRSFTRRLLEVRDGRVNALEPTVPSR
jgi:ATP-binding cassette subfamily F protein 3